MRKLLKWLFEREPVRRRGIVVVTAVGGGLCNKGEPYRAQVIVEEMGVSGPLSRVRVVSVSGVNNDYRRDFENFVPEYIESSQIDWLAPQEQP